MKALTLFFMASVILSATGLAQDLTGKLAKPRPYYLFGYFIENGKVTTYYGHHDGYWGGAVMDAIDSCEMDGHPRVDCQNMIFEEKKNLQ